MLYQRFAFLFEKKVLYWNNRYIIFPNEVKYVIRKNSPTILICVLRGSKDVTQ